MDETREQGQDLAKRIHEARARAAAKELFLAKMMLILYCIYTCEIAVVILASGGRWFALLAPVLAACGPRYWKSMSDKVTFYSFVVVICGAVALGCVLVR